MKDEITTPQDRIQPNEPDKANPVEVSPLELILEIRGLRTQLAAAQRERDEWKVDATEWGEVAAIRQREVNGLRAQLAAAERERDKAKKEAAARLEQTLGQSRAYEQAIREWKAEVARLTSALDTLTQEREEFIRYCQSLQLASGEVGPIQVARMHIDRLTSQVAELQRDRERLDWLEGECFDVRCENIPTGQGDADVGWIVISHHMAKPFERQEGIGGDNIREAIDAAMRAKGEA